MTFTLKLKLNDCNQKLHPDLEPGVLVQQEIVFSDELSPLQISVALLHIEDDFIKNHIKVEIVEQENLRA